MRDIVNVSINILSASGGIAYGSSVYANIEESSDFVIDLMGYLIGDGDLFTDGELHE